MKKIIVITAIFFCTFHSTIFSQAMLVNDPTNLAKIGEVLKSAQEQVDKIKEQTEVLKEAERKLTKINSYVSSANAIKRTLEQQKTIIGFFYGDLMKINGDALSPKALLAYAQRIQNYRTRILDNNTYLLQLLTDNAFQMSDYERLTSINKINDENQQILSTAKAEKDRYEYLNNQLIILRSLKK